MLDIKLIRNNPEDVKKRLAARNFKTAVVDEILDLDKNKREYQQKLEDIRSQKNQFNKNMQKFSAQEKKEKLGEMARLVKEESKIEDEIKETTETFNKLILELPNLPLPDVKKGKDSHLGDCSRAPANHSYHSYGHGPGWGAGAGGACAATGRENWSSS